jgi:hypothetical protein
MKRKTALVWTLVVVCVLALAPVSAKAAAARRTLKVKLNYTGAERVDQNHKIYVLLFDANPYTSKSLIDSTAEAAPPAAEEGVCHILRREAASGRKQVLTFNGLGASSVYVMAFVDKSGNYDPHSDPPSGSPTAMYGKSAGQPEQITLEGGKAVTVTLAFDDSHKLP